MSQPRGAARIPFLDTVTIPAAGTVVGDWVTDLQDVTFLTLLAKLARTSGGTTLDVYIQTSLDNGATAIDIAHFSFATTTASKMLAVSGAGALVAATAPGDGALAADTTLDGVMGDRFRVKYVVVGTYVGTISVWGIAKSGAGAPKAIASTMTSTQLPAALGQAVAASALPVVEATAATATVTSVADQATSTTILALNTARIGATIYNDSSAILYLKLGTTASATDFTVKLFTDDYYEVPSKYTGRIDGIWSADSSGSARITELT